MLKRFVLALVAASFLAVPAAARTSPDALVGAVFITGKTSNAAREYKEIVLKDYLSPEQVELFDGAQDFLIQGRYVEAQDFRIEYLTIINKRISRGLFLGDRGGAFAADFTTGIACAIDITGHMGGDEMAKQCVKFCDCEEN